jgi:hypothetical protein
VPDATKTIRPIVEQRNYLVHDPLVGGFQGRPGREEYQKFNFVLKMVTELCLLSVMKMPKKENHATVCEELFTQGYCAALIQDVALKRRGPASPRRRLLQSHRMLSNIPIPENRCSVDRRRATKGVARVE